jgi:ribosomal protein S18 acetylase RimI-like enzyme
VLEASEYASIGPLLHDLLLEEQRHYDHPQRTGAEVEADMEEPPQPSFRGENVILAVRTAAGEVAAFCWCVLFDPGTGLEAEVAEVYVQPSFREQGLGRRLLQKAVELFRQRGVTFASVWTREDNPQAVRLYEQAGFRRTEQLVLTWLPLPARP